MRPKRLGELRALGPRAVTHVPSQNLKFEINVSANLSKKSLALLATSKG